MQGTLREIKPRPKSQLPWIIITVKALNFSVSIFKPEGSGSTHQALLPAARTLFYIVNYPVPRAQGVYLLYFIIYLLFQSCGNTAGSSQLCFKMVKLIQPVKQAKRPLGILFSLRPALDIRLNFLTFIWFFYYRFGGLPARIRNRE